MGKISRRGFGRTAAGVLMIAPSQAAQQPQQPAADQPEIDAKFANVIRKYGNRLSEEQRTRIRGIIGRHERMMARVRAFPLENGDAPATTLRLQPKD